MTNRPRFRTSGGTDPATLIALGALAAVLAAPGCKSSKCYPDCVAGYEPVPNACTCRPVADAATDGASSDATDESTVLDAASDGSPLGSCVPGSVCGPGSTCIEGCPASAKPAIGSVGGICSVPGRDTCGCGATIDTCTTPGTVCLMPACCDYEGICVTPAERAAICARPESAHFDCSSIDASADGNVDAGATTARKRVFHLLNGALGAIRDANDTRTGLEVADADCTTAGQMYGGGQWRAWLSDSSMNAIDRLVDVGPWYRLDQQTKLFDSRAGITQGPLVPIEDPTDAGAGTRGLFWSGTLLDGTASAGNCSDWTSYVGGGTATVGRTDTAGSGWVDPTPLSCSKYLSLLCFEQ